jgi:hypothetical protein
MFVPPFSIYALWIRDYRTRLPRLLNSAGCPPIRIAVQYAAYEKEDSMKRFALVLLLLVCCIPLASAQSTCLLTFQTESVPQFTIGEPAHFQIEGVSGTEPYTFTVVDGAFPAGLHLNRHGKITGSPSEVTDTTVLVNLTDAAGCQINQAFDVQTVAP